MPLTVTIGLSLLTLAVLAAQAPGTARQPEDRFVTSDGLRIHYLDWGNPSAPPFVMLHGIDRIARTFDHVAPHFTDRYHVIAMDLRGHGDSETTFATHGDVVTGQDLIAIVEHLGGAPAVLGGNSMG
ncbi:MAG TPA: alpha/beta fold hydrolase, partial [Pseudolysinimonas sp.]|nr:alpha/beta fold hydrolase [Pseudolysinimonas sp.]